MALAARLLAVLLLFATLGAAPASQTFTGTISDDLCEGDHAPMQMGPTDAECTIACLEAHDAAFVLWDGKVAYKLSDQVAPKALAGKKVKIVGTLDEATKTITVESIAAE